MSTPSVSEIARRILELLGPNGEHWTKGVAYRNNGQSCTPEEATEMCVLGAIYLAVGGKKDFRSVAVLLFPEGGESQFSTIDWNDSSDWPTVKAKLEELSAMEG